MLRNAHCSVPARRGTGPRPTGVSVQWEKIQSDVHFTQFMCKCQVFSLRNQRYCTVARGPSDAIRASERVSPAIGVWRGTGPRPTVKGGRVEDIARPFAIRRSQTTEYRRAGPLGGFHTRIRAGSRRERSRAPETVVRDRLIPNGSSARPPHLP